MASRMVGRTACPECGFGSAHVKESEKCLYRYCPECGAPYHAKTERQRADLMAKTRPNAPLPEPVPVAEQKQEPVAEVKPEPVPEPIKQTEPAPAPKKRRGLFA